ncbi:MAG: hypothetical protein AB7N65_03065 [Vicinamibacterales bacterium]
MPELAPNTVAFEPGSVVDPVGRVFHLDGRVFRAIAPGYDGFVAQTLDRAVRLGWFDAGLIPTWRTSYTLPGFPLVIEHQRIPVVTLRGEWTAEGVRDAALCILHLSARLCRSNLCLKDAHPWNVLFDGTTPYFIDWGSLAPAEDLNWPFWYRQFRQYLLAPLHAFSTGLPRIARAMLREQKIGVGNEIIELPELAQLPGVPHEIAQLAGTAPTVGTFEALAAYVSSLTFPNVDGEWSSYGQPVWAPLDFGALRGKDRVVHRILAGDPGRSLLDLGTNRGLHSEMAASLGKRVVACDIEEGCLNDLYLRTRASRVDVLPLYHDFLWPIGTSGILNSIPAAEDRLACDTLLMMAVVHHLAFKLHVSFEAMARGIARLARHRAVVEFVPPDDEHVARWSPERLPWYGLDRFVAAMRRHFDIQAMVSSEPAPRCVIVFDKQ